MSSQLSLDDLRTIIKNRYSKPVNLNDEKKNLVNYYFNVLSVMLYDPEKSLNEIKDNLLLKYNSITLNKLLYNVPSPDDIIYFTTGNREDLVGPINTLKKTLDKLNRENGFNTETTASGDTGYLIYDHDYAMTQASYH